MVIPQTIPAKTAKNLEPGMTKARQKLTQKGAQLEINTPENGWEINIREKLQTDRVQDSHEEQEF